MKKVGLLPFICVAVMSLGVCEGMSKSSYSTQNKEWDKKWSEATKRSSSISAEKQNVTLISYKSLETVIGFSKKLTDSQKRSSLPAHFKFPSSDVDDKLEARNAAFNAEGDKTKLSVEHVRDGNKNAITEIPTPEELFDELYGKIKTAISEQRISKNTELLLIQEIENKKSIFRQMYADSIIDQDLDCVYFTEKKYKEYCEQVTFLRNSVLIPLAPIKNPVHKKTPQAKGGSAQKFLKDFTQALGSYGTYVSEILFGIRSALLRT